MMSADVCRDRCPEDAVAVRAWRGERSPRPSSIQSVRSARSSSASAQRCARACGSCAPCLQAPARRPVVSTRFDGADRSDDPLLDQVEQREPVTLVLLRERDDEPEVRVDQASTSSWRRVRLPSRQQTGSKRPPPTYADKRSPRGVRKNAAEDACDQRDGEPVVAHVALAELACHAGGRGFESRRSRSENPLQIGISVVTHDTRVVLCGPLVARGGTAKRLQIALSSRRLCAASRAQQVIE